MTWDRQYRRKKGKRGNGKNKNHNHDRTGRKDGGRGNAGKQESSDHGFSEIGEMTEAEADRYAVASDLANVCEYLEDSEVIKIRLIVNKAQARKEREENGG